MLHTLLLILDLAAPVLSFGAVGAAFWMAKYQRAERRSFVKTLPLVKEGQVVTFRNQHNVPEAFVVLERAVGGDVCIVTLQDRRSFLAQASADWN